MYVISLFESLTKQPENAIDWPEAAYSEHTYWETCGGTNFKGSDLIVSIGLLQLVSASCNKSANDKLA